MGWTSYTIDTADKTDAVLRREFTQDSQGGTRPAWDIVKSATVGAQWYAIMCRTSWDECTPDGSTAERKQYYGLICLTQRKVRKGTGMTEFYYKDMDESCGPYAYAMPLQMLEELERLAPAPEGYAAGWREGVRMYHARKAAKAKAKRENMKRLQDFMKAHIQVVHIGGHA